MSILDGLQNIKNLFDGLQPTPDVNQPVGVGTQLGSPTDILTGPDYTTGGITRNTVLGLPSAALGVFKNIGQGIARTVGSIGTTAGNIPTQIANDTFLQNNKQPLPFDQSIPTTGNPITSNLFGGEPIETIQERAKNLQTTLAPYIGKTSAGNLSFPLVGAGMLLDMSPFGGGTAVDSFSSGEVPEAFWKYLAKESDPANIENTLKGIGLDTERSKAVAPMLANAKTVDEVKNIAINFENPDILKLGETSAPGTAPISTPALPPPSEPFTLTPDEVSSLKKQGFKPAQIKMIEDAENAKNAIESYFKPSPVATEVAPEAPIKSIQFVSPNVKENLTPEEVATNMKSPSYQQNYNAVQNTYANDGIEGNLIKGVGDWADGSEETYIKEITNDVPEDKRIYSLSKSAKALIQKDAIDFGIDPTGKDELYRITPDGKSINEVKALLDNNGIKFKTLGPDTLYVINSGEYFDNGIIDKLQGLEDNGGIKVKMDNGKATFITGVDDRDVAQGKYDKIISNYEQKYGNQQGNKSQSNPIPGEPIQGEGSTGLEEKASVRQPERAQLGGSEKSSQEQNAGSGNLENASPTGVNPPIKMDENGMPLALNSAERGIVGSGIKQPPWKSSNFIPNQNIPFLNVLKVPDLTIQGDTPKERIADARTKAEEIYNRLANASKTVYQIGTSLKLTDPELKIIRDAYQAGTPINEIASQSSNPKGVKKLLTALKNYNALEITLTQAAGGLTEEEANHMRQMWNLNKTEDLDKFNKIVSQQGKATWKGFGYQPKIFPSYAEGEKAGFTPLNKNFIEDILQQGQQAAENISKAVLRNGLREAAPDMVSNHGLGFTNKGKPYVNLNIPGLQGMSVHPDMANQLKGYDVPSQNSFIRMAQAESKAEGGGIGTTIKKLPQTAKEAGLPADLWALYDGASQELKGIIYNLSLFHVANISSKVAGWSLLENPIKGGKILAQSAPTFVSKEMMQDLLNNYDKKIIPGSNMSVLDAALRSGQNINVGTPSTGIEKLNPLQQLTKATFDRQLLALQLGVNDMVFGDGKIDPSSKDGRELGKEIETLMGKINPRTMNISPTTLRNVSRVLATPGFTMSKWKMIGDALTKWGQPSSVGDALKHPFKVLTGNKAGNFARKAVMGDHILTFIVSSLVTFLMTGKFPKLSQIFNIQPTTPSNIRKNGIVQNIAYPETYLGEISKITNPGQYINSRVNPVLRNIMEALPYSNTLPFGKNYYGKAIINPKSNVSPIVQYFQNTGIGNLPIGIQNTVNLMQGSGNKNGLEKIMLGISGLTTTNPPKKKASQTTLVGW